ncbi:MAG: aspartate/glutamate racemase family protein [Candidatus Paceibacterales bacterium]
MKTIGILGGMGPQATMDFENKLHLAAQNLIPQKANEGYPKIITYYFRQPPFKADGKGKAVEPLEPNPELLKAAAELGSLCDFLAIPSNTAHLFQNEIEQASGKRVLSIVEAAFNEVSKRAVKKVGILGMGLTTKHQLYQTKLEGLGLDWLTIEQDMSGLLDKFVFDYMEGKITQEGHDLAVNCLEFIRKQGAEAIIIASDEVLLLLGNKYAEAKDVINPAELLAETAIQFAIK